MPVDRSDDRVHRQADVFRHRQVVSADDLVVAAVHGDQELERRAAAHGAGHAGRDLAVEGVRDDDADRADDDVGCAAGHGDGIFARGAHVRAGDRLQVVGAIAAEPVEERLDLALLLVRELGAAGVEVAQNVLAETQTVRVTEVVVNDGLVPSVLDPGFLGGARTFLPVLTRGQ